MADDEIEEGDIEEGDIVWIGKPGKYKVHWIVLDLHEGTHDNIVLKSGLTGRLKYLSEQGIEILTLHSKGQS